MFLTRIDDVSGDDYKAHQRVRELFESQKVLFQRKGHEIVVLSEAAVSESQDVSQILGRIVAGEKMLFRLRVNACVTKFIDGKNRRVGLPANGIDAWLRSIFAKNGFKADFVHRNEGIRRSAKGKSSISVSSVVATGVLTVEDAGKCRTAIVTGIGHAKGLGFGFLNVFDVM